MIYDIFAGEPGLPLYRPLPEPAGSFGLWVGAGWLAALGRRARAR